MIKKRNFIYKLFLLVCHIVDNKFYAQIFFVGYDSQGVKNKSGFELVSLYSVIGEILMILRLLKGHGFQMKNEENKNLYSML
jgi:hypothetical protein